MIQALPLAALLAVQLTAAPATPDGAASDADLLKAPDGTVLAPGVSVRVYDVGENMANLPVLVEGQTPNVSFVRRTLALDNDFGLDDRFLTAVDAFLKIDEAGKYTLRLVSDDGSKLYLGDKLLIDRDGLHSEGGKDANVDLTPGLHEFRVWHFDNTHDAVLRLEWKPPGAADFTVVPASNLYAPADEVRVTSPGPKKVQDPEGRAFLRPGDGAPLKGVHPSYTLTTLAHEGFEPRVGGIGFLPDGRMVLCTWSPNGDVFIIDNVETNDPSKLEIKRFASGLAEPLGVQIVDGRIFVLQKQELTELIDHDHDGTADEYRAVASGWNVSPNFHEFAFGPVYKDGYFYFNLATAIDPGGASTRPQIYGRGTCVKVNAETGEYEFIAGGLRTPNGIALGPNDEIFVADNQGDWLPSSKIVHVKPGRHFGNHILPAGPFDEQPETKPVVWLPQGEIGNSPTEPILMKDGVYAGQMLHGDVTYGGLQRVYLDEVDGELQGCVFRFTQGLTGGVNRLEWGPPPANKHLFVGGIGSGGNWGQEGKKKFGLDRLTFTGAPAFEMLTVRAMSNGFEVTLTEPLEESFVPQPEHFAVSHWWYEPTKQYGGPKKDVTRVTTKSVTLSGDRKTIFVELDDMGTGPVLAQGVPAGRVYHIRIAGKPKSQGGRELWSTEAWYTLNRIPSDRVGKVDPVRVLHNVLTDEERAEGWLLLFNGQDLSGWRNFRGSGAPKGWAVQDGALARVSGGGDIVTEKQYGDFELTLDWKISEGGNSGIFYRGSEEHSPIYATAPEMQVLDNGRHRDGRNPLTSAGSLYALIPPVADVTSPPGQWNQARLIARGKHVEHWLNGTKLLEAEIGSDEWRELVAESKFRDMPHFAGFDGGVVGLQDHGDPVWYRNIKIRPLKAE